MSVRRQAEAMSRARRGVALAAMLAALPASGAAEGPAPQGAHGDWVLISGGGVCQLRHTRISERSGAVLLEMLLLPPGAGGSGALAGLRVPVGVSLRDGIAWRHPSRPDAAVALAWQHCDAELCLAAGGISESELERLRRGNRIEVGFRPLPNANPIRMAVSLRGVTSGWRALEACAATAG